MAGDMCWGTNPALDLPLPKGAEGVEGAGKQTQVVVSAVSSCPSFLTALPRERLTRSKPSSNRDPKQEPGCWKPFDAPAVCPSPSPSHLALGKGHRGCFLRSHLHGQGGTCDRPARGLGAGERGWEEDRAIHSWADLTF